MERKRKDPSNPALADGKRPRDDAAPAEAFAPWATLPEDMLLEVAARVLANDVVDYIAFRGACSGWRACTPSPRNPTLRVPPARPVDWVPLCDGDAVRPDAACEMALFNTRTPRSLRVRLPELKGHRIIGFTDGLVILLNKRTAAVRVLHPFTRVAVDFPSLVPVYHRLIKRRGRVLRMGAAVCNSASSAASIAVVAWFPGTPVVLSAEAGHASWEVVHEDLELSTALPFNGQLYGVVQSAWQIVQVYPPKPEPLPPVVVADIPHQFNSPGLYHYYLVESDGFMLLDILI